MTASSSQAVLPPGWDDDCTPRTAEELALIQRIKSLQEVIGESRNGMSSAQSRLTLLSRRKAAQALEGLSEAHMQEFRAFKLIRVPSSSAGCVICAICTLLALEEPVHGPGAAKKKQEVLPWTAARAQLTRPDLLRALVNFDALRLVDAPELAAKLRQAIRKDDKARSRRHSEARHGQRLGLQPARHRIQHARR